MDELIVMVYDVSAFAGALFLMFVIRQALNDLHLRRTDPLGVQAARKVAFFSSASFLMLTVIFQDYWLRSPSVITTGLVATGLVGGGTVILVVNVISLYKRAPRSPPTSGYRFANVTSGWRKPLTGILNSSRHKKT